ncbi:Isoprenoid synthase domain containing protein [Rhypophila sp. PSN 637]
MESPSVYWTHEIHPRAEEVAQEVDNYFLQNWNFADERARKTFLKAGFSHDGRIHYACRLLTVLFLIDDILEDMFFADGEALNNRLMELSKGPQFASPDREIPAEYIIYDLWESMRYHDLDLANEELGRYLQYREKDVGMALLSALMRYSMELRPTAAELAALKPLEENCSKHISIVDDIYSYEKEVIAAQTGHKEGSFLCSAVKVLSAETALGIPANKRVLRSMVRGWELIHDAMVEGLAAEGVDSQNVKDYVRGLQYQMSGNEQWSRTTPRYIEQAAWQ